MRDARYEEMRDTKRSQQPLDSNRIGRRLTLRRWLSSSRFVASKLASLMIKVKNIMISSAVSISRVNNNYEKNEIKTLNSSSAVNFNPDFSSSIFARETQEPGTNTDTYTEDQAHALL